MLRKLFSSSLILVSCITLFTANIFAQPTLTPPAVTGPDSLIGFEGQSEHHEFLTQTNSSRGDIKDVFPGQDYWIYVVGIDASGVTGPAGRKIQFNLQNTVSGFTKHLGISVSLDNPGVGGADLLECYQSDGVEGISSHGFFDPELDTTIFDVRFQFTKAQQGDFWTVTPWFRLPGQSWQQFEDGVFTGTVVFDFDEARLDVWFKSSADGVIEFDNFFILGPIPEPITEIYVDDDWVSQNAGDAVQFPGQIDVRVIGVNAFATVQAGVDSLLVRLPASIPTLHIAAGNYSENVFLSGPVNLQGSGNGTNTAANTVINGANFGAPVIEIGNNVGGSSKNSRMVIRDLRVRGATGAGDTPSGILMTSGFGGMIETLAWRDLSRGTSTTTGLATNEYITFENVAAVGNAGNGIAIDHLDTINDIELINCKLDSNTNHGFLIPTDIASFDSLMMSGCEVKGNGITGVSTGPDGSQGVTNIHISNSTFSGNGDALSASGSGSGDISLFKFNGNASLTNVDVTGDGAHIGIQVRGDTTFAGALQPAGTVVFNDVTLSGQYQHPTPTWVGSGLFISGYSDVSSISFSNVDIDISRVGSKGAANLYLDNIEGNLDVSDMMFGSADSVVSILNISVAEIDANNAVFAGNPDNFEIEDRVFHALDSPAFGLVRWTGKQIYVTPKAFAPPDTAVLLNRIVGVVSAGDTINFAAGTYYDTTGVVIDKDLTFFGVSTGTTVCRPLANATGSGLGGAWFIVDTLVTVNIYNINFDGSGFSIRTACRVRGRGSCGNLVFTNISGPGRSGVGIVAAGDTAVQITNCTFSNMGRAGVQFLGTGVQGSLFRGNTYIGKGSGVHLEYGVELEGGASVTMKQDTIYNCSGVVDAELDSVSAGIRVSTLNGDGTSVTIDSSQIYNCYNGIEIGSGISDQSFAIIRNCDIYNNTVGIQVNSALFVKAEDDSIHNNTEGIRVEYATVFDLDRDDILDNQTGIIIKQSFGEIDECIIANSDSNGVSILDELSTSVTLHRNEFCSNGLFGLESLGASTVDATTNWWGASDGPGGSGSGSGDAISDGVDFSLFETSGLFPNSPCSGAALCVADGDVNNSGGLSGQDALCAFLITLNGQQVPAECDVANFECEVVAADVNCDATVSAADALAIFERALAFEDPALCFAGPSLAKSGATPYSLSLAPDEGDSGSSGSFKVALRVADPAGLRAFTARFEFPADKVEFLGVERSSATANWVQLDARVNEAGRVTVGGFNIQPLQGSPESEIFQLLFSRKSVATGPIEISVSSLADDLAGATLQSHSVQVNGVAPESFALRQNYPNPFNPETLIQYDIPLLQAGKVAVQITIYNVKGQLVRALLKDKKAAGTYKVKWDGKNDRGVLVPSGAYFYTLKAGEFKDTRRMMLVK
ncbi:MAG: FlgD immunoglobulin-like domain containing protein [bacterium]